MIRFPQDVERFTFPDGQSHIRIPDNIFFEHVVPNGYVTINARITSNNDLVDFCSLIDILRANKVREIHVKFLYLIGQRMDRAISNHDPMTLRTIVGIINSLNLTSIQVFCPHSQTTLNMLNGGFATDMHNEEYYFYKNAIKHTKEFTDQPVGIVLPDDGGAKRWHNNFSALNTMGEVIECSKHRDMATGKLSGFDVHSDTVPEVCLIVDDLCCGGFTFVSLAKELHKKGAKRVELAVCHGILSKGYPLQHIDKIYTTDSYQTFEANDYLDVTEL